MNISLFLIQCIQQCDHVIDVLKLATQTIPFNKFCVELGILVDKKIVKVDPYGYIWIDDGSPINNDPVIIEFI